jgi:hypothetical protein
MVATASTAHQGYGVVAAGPRTAVAMCPTSLAGAAADQTGGHGCVIRAADSVMRRATLFNLDALFELIVGFVLVFNPLLGPVLPAPGWLVALVGVGLLVAACVIGRAGMGKGALVTRIRPFGAANIATGVVAGLWALAACDAGGRILVLLIAAGLVVLGVAQFTAGGRNEAPGRIGRTNTTRATADELSRALHRKSSE